MFERLLLPVDGSESSDRAVGHAAVIADRYDATVHALHVLDDANLPVDFDEFEEGEQVRVEIESEGIDALEAAVERLADADVPTTREQREGVPATEILDCAAERNADLIVAGMHTQGRLERFLQRSVTQQLAREAEVPVLSVPKSADSDPDYERILVATDGRQGAEQATECAYNLADHFESILHGIVVLDSRTARRGPLKRAIEQEASETKRRLRADAAQLGRDIVIAQREGRPAAEILTYAADEDVDLLAIGTHGRTGLDRYLMGSVASDVLREATVPVLTARTINAD